MVSRVRTVLKSGRLWRIWKRSTAILRWCGDSEKNRECNSSLGLQRHGVSHQLLQPPRRLPRCVDETAPLKPEYYMVKVLIIRRWVRYSKDEAFAQFRLLSSPSTSVPLRRCEEPPAALLHRCRNLQTDRVERSEGCLQCWIAKLNPFLGGRFDEPWGSDCRGNEDSHFFSSNSYPKESFEGNTVFFWCLFSDRARGNTKSDMYS